MSAAADRRSGQPVVRVRKTLFIALLILSGCDDPGAQERHQDRADEYITYMYPVCRDGVEYLVQAHGYSTAVTPHLKPDGKPYACGDKK